MHEHDPSSPHLSSPLLLSSLLSSSLLRSPPSLFLLSSPLLSSSLPLLLQEFSKEVDTRSSLHASVLSLGAQLLRLKKVDVAALRAQMARVDTQWADLLTRIPLVQEKLHQVSEAAIFEA